MLKVVGLLALVSVAYAAEARFPSEEKPAELANQEGCYISEIGRVLPFEFAFYPNTDCGKYICQRGSNETLYETCGALAINEGCRKTVVDNSKQYPACCGTEVCDTTTTISPTTADATTTEAPATTTGQPSNQESSAYASAQSADGQPPKTVEETSGPDAHADVKAS